MTSVPTFGRPRTESDAAPRTNDLIDARELPSRGIFYCMNHLRRMWQAGKFPAPVRLSPRRLAWREADIDAWIASKVAEAGQRSA